MLGQSGIIKSGTICGTMFGRCMMLFPPKHPKTIALYVYIYTVKPASWQPNAKAIDERRQLSQFNPRFTERRAPRAWAQRGATN